MKTRYRLIRRGLRGGAYYCVDSTTGKRISLSTQDEDEARQIIEAKNQSQRQPALNLQIAKAYLAGADPNFVKRTWRELMDEFVRGKQGSNLRLAQRRGKGL